MMYAILIYDISLDENGSKSMRNVFKICKKYLSHVQKSVFEGELSDSSLRQLKYELSPYIRDDLDSVILFTSRQQKWLQKEFWGRQEDPTSNFL